MTEQNQTENTQPKLTEETLFEKLVNIFNEIWTLEADMKDILDQAKEDGVEEIPLVKAIAKAKAYNSVGKLEEKAKAQLEKISQLVG